MSPLIAQDADGTNVPASYEIDNAQHHVTINVPHRDRDVHYPILVDPAVEIYQYLGDTGAHGVYPGWGYVGSTALSYSQGYGYFGDGIYSWRLPNIPYQVFDYGTWYFHAPGNSSVIGAQLWNSYYTQASRSCLAMGILDANGSWETHGLTTLYGSYGGTGMPFLQCPPGYADQQRQIIAPGTPGNAVAMQFISLGDTSPYVDLVYLKDTHVFITTPIRPPPPRATCPTSTLAPR